MILSWIKRIVPFLVAFALGLLIASFFITIGLPRIGMRRTACFERMRAEREAMRAADEAAQNSRQRAIEAQNEAFRNRGESCRSRHLAERQARRNAEEMRFEDESFDDAIPVAPIPPAPRSRR